MIILKLLGYAVGSVVMYWGLLLLLLAPWFLAMILILLTNQIWNRLTGQTDEWVWFVGWFERLIQTINRVQFRWVGWIPGLLIQIWYAGYAAHLVQTSTSEAAPFSAVGMPLLGLVGLIAAAAIFYGLYTWVAEVKLPQWIYLLVGGISLSAYVGLLTQPQIAAVLSESWQRVFAALLIAAS